MTHSIISHFNDATLTQGNATTYLKSLLNITGGSSYVLGQTLTASDTIDAATPSTQWCGVLPYAYKSNKIVILLGFNKRTRKYAGFGGHCNIGETPVQCASREAEEELKAMFGDRWIIETCLEKDINHAHHSETIPQHNNYLFMYRIYFNPEINDIYQRIPTLKKETQEMCNIRWFTLEQLLSGRHLLDRYFVSDLDSGLFNTLEDRQIKNSN